MSANPLKQFARTPKIYIKLPTNNKFYPNDLMHVSANGEVPIKAMTATDDLMMNSPDALLNGDAVFHLLNSCLTDCKDIKQLLVPDVETILLAVRYASQGDKLKLQTTCPECEKPSEEIVSIRNLIDQTVTLDESGIDNVVTITHDDGTKIHINMKPSPYTDVTRANIVLFEQTRLIQYLQANNDIDDEERNNRIKEGYDKLAKFQSNAVINSIEQIDIITKNDDEEAEDVVIHVTDVNHISEFVNDLETHTSKKINEVVEQLNTDIGVPNQLPVVCDECNHEYVMEVKYDPTNFSEDS